MLPVLGPDRVRFGVAVAATGVCYQGLLHVLFRRTRQMPPVIAYTDLVICMLFPLLLHKAFLPAVIVALGVTAQTTITTGRRTALSAHLSASAGFALVGLVIDSPDTWMILAFLITGCLVVANIGTVADTEAASRVRYLALVEGLQGIVWEGDADTFGFTYVSPKAETILGYPLEDWYQEGFWEDHLHPEDRDEAVEFCRDAEASGRDHELEYRMISASGKVVHLHDVVAVSADASGRALTVHGVMLDVTERKRIEQRVRQYADIVETIDIGLVVVPSRRSRRGHVAGARGGQPGGLCRARSPARPVRRPGAPRGAPRVGRDRAARPPRRRGPARPLVRDRRDRRPREASPASRSSPAGPSPWATSSSASA